MLISTKGRYALRTLIDLAENQGTGLVPLRLISERQQISEKYLELILRILVESGIVAGRRGKSGGYRLLADPKELSVATIFTLTEGTLAPVTCLEDPTNSCPRHDLCNTLPLYKEINRRVMDYLESVHLSDLLGGSNIPCRCV